MAARGYRRLPGRRWTSRQYDRPMDAMSGWTTAIRADAGLAVEHPASWPVSLEVPGVAVMILAAEESVAGFRANVAIAAQDLPGPVTLEAFTALQLATMGQAHADARLIDRSAATLLGQPAERALLLYRQGIYSLALERWWTARDGGEAVVVVSATCAALDYDGYADTFSAIAAGVAATGG